VKNKIALEEHFAIDLTIEQSRIYAPPVVWERLKAALLDIEQQRLERMEQLWQEAKKLERPKKNG